MKLEEGMYVRTKEGKIGKIIDINLGQEEKRYILDSSSVYIYYEKDISKSSHNIIDLVQLGDYVNGYPVYETIEYPDNTRAIVIADDNKSIIWEESSQYIKSIVTKEQMESMKYEVE